MTSTEASLITPGQIEEWIREVEERPSSAAAIIRQVANRLSELTQKNEKLLAENIALQLGKKVEEYESRIANLEYQLEMLKRQVGEPGSTPKVGGVSLLVYDPQGRILRLELSPDQMDSAGFLASFTGDPAPLGEAPHLLVADTQEELLVVFDSGRAVTMPVADVPAADPENLDWEQAFIQEPRGIEALAFVIPIARMSLFAFGLQVSRRGFVKKIKESFLATCVANSNVGTGVVLSTDRTCSLSLCQGDDLLVMLSYEGYLLCLQVDQMLYTIEEALNLGVTDHIVTAFVPGDKASILALTQNGKVFNRDRNWLEPASSSKTRGKPILNKARLEAGTRIAGAAAVNADDWAVILTSDGNLTAHKTSDLVGAGSVPGTSTDIEILNFAVFSA